MLLVIWAAARKVTKSCKTQGDFQSLELGIGLIELGIGVISNNARCTVLAGLASFVCDTVCT